jgi:hypothetical protein
MVDKMLPDRVEPGVVTVTSSTVVERTGREHVPEADQHDPRALGTGFRSLLEILTEPRQLRAPRGDVVTHRDEGKVDTPTVNRIPKGRRSRIRVRVRRRCPARLEAFVGRLRKPIQVELRRREVQLGARADRRHELEHRVAQSRVGAPAEAGGARYHRAEKTLSLNRSPPWSFSFSLRT